MKTYEQLMKHYWGKIVPMAEAAGINPWECVKDTLTKEIFNDHPVFTLNSNRYTFALTVLEEEPVFVGDKLYFRENRITVQDDGHPFMECTWTPPTKKRTFMLGDKELPCPLKVVPDKYSVLTLLGMNYYFNNWREANSVANEILSILTNASKQE